MQTFKIHSTLARNISFFLRRDPAVPKALRHVLGEFAEAKGGALKCAQVREQGRVICAQNAVATIGEYLI